MADEVKVLIVDDSEISLPSIERQLKESKDPVFKVSAFRNPYDAFTFVLSNPGALEFAFIDHMLVGDRSFECPIEVPVINSGLDLTRAISQRWPHIGIILYSGDESITEDDEWEGLAAGAHRYVYIEPGNLQKVATREFVSEILELRELQETLANFQKVRDQTDILQRSVRVGVDLIDRRFKIWYMNRDYREIVGGTKNPNQFCCACNHNRKWPPCRGCLVKEGLQLSKVDWEQRKKRIDRIFYSPVYAEGKCSFRYMHVWAEPVYSRDSAKEQPIAVVESVIDLTDSPTIKNMSIEENLEILIRTITELTCEWLEPKRVPLSHDERWEEPDERRGFTRVRVYRADTQETSPAIKVLRTNNSHRPDITNVLIPLKKFPGNLPDRFVAVSAMAVDDINEYIDVENVYRLQVACSGLPLMFLLFGEGGRWIGVVSIDEEIVGQDVRKFGEKDVGLLQPYVDEIARVIDAKLNKTGFIGSETSRIIEEVQSKIVLAKTPEEALQVVIDGIVGKRGIDMGHIRVIKGGKLHLVAGKGLYYEHATPVIPADRPQSLSRLVAGSGMPLVVNKRPDVRIEESFTKMPASLREVMERVKSVGVFPLKAFGRLEAVLSLHSEQPEVFNNETVLLCARLAEIASYLLHDISLATEAEKKTSEIWKNVAASFAERIGNILPIAQRRLRMILVHVAEPDMKEDARIGLDSVDRAVKLLGVFESHSWSLPLVKTSCTVEHLMVAILQICLDSHPHHAIGLVPLAENVKACSLDADIDALQNVFLSFVQDSVRFHRTHNPRVDIECRFEGESPSNRIEILYRDDGPGIPEDQKKRVFDPFYTVNSGGTGIGLTEAKKVIEAHGGSIEDRGTPGQGVEFVIILPVTRR